MEPGRKLATAEELKGRKNSSAPGRKKGNGNHRFLLLTVIVLALLALAAAVYVISGQVQPEPKDGTETVSPAGKSEMVKLIDRTREEVASVTVARGGGEYTVINGKAGDETAGVHTLKGLPSFDLDQNKADMMIGCAAKLTANRLVTDSAESLEPYGLADPKARVTMSYRDGTETVWLIGDKAPTSTASYFMEEGTRTVYLLYASAIESLSSERNALHTLSMPLVLNANLIRSLTLEGDGRDTIEIGYSEEGSADRGYSISALRLRQPFYYTANAERVSELFNGVSSLKIAAYAGELEELDNTGLENGGSRWRLTVQQAKDKEHLTDTETWVCRIGNRTEDGKSVYFAADNTQAVYLADAASTAFLEDATPAYLVDQFTNLIYINAVNGIEIAAGEERWTLEIEHAEDDRTEDTFRFNGVPVQKAEDFRKLYQQIVGMTSSKISPDYFMDGEILLSVRYRLDVEPGELLVEYIAYDEDYCAVRRDGLTLFLIKREQVNALTEALRQFTPLGMFLFDGT